jgi:hypothetical protein
MTNNPAGLLPVVLYFVAVLVSLPASLVTYGLGRWLGSTALAVRYVAAGLAGLVLAVGTALAVFVNPVVGATVVALAAAGAVVLAAFPLFIGRQLIERWTGLSGEMAREYAVLCLPVALVASAVLFVAPGGTERYNLTVLSGPVAALVWLGLGLVVTLGPGVAGYGMYRLVDRFG